jgi:hypothetical protein
MVNLKIKEKFQKLIIRGVNTLSFRARWLLHVPRKPRFPLADRLLTDALMLAEIPSPTEHEGQRSFFVLERLKSLGFSPLLDETGTILTRVHAKELANLPPLLLFTNLGSSRWHPLESLSRLDAENARGAGLADSLGAAALLSVAEGVSTGRLETSRELILLFSADSFDTPECGIFLPVTKNEANRPIAAIGVRGLRLGTIVKNAWGIYRMKIAISLDTGKGERKEGRPKKAETRVVPGSSGLVVETLLDTAHKLAGITWDCEGTTRLYIRRIEAETTFGRIPSEGLLEIELESSDGALLDMAMKTVKATVETAAASPELKTEVLITSFIPVGDASVNNTLMKAVKGIMKGQRIKVQEENGADIAACLSIRGIPALSLGIASGREGMVRDTIEIDSIERGRVLLEALIDHLIKEES